MKPKLIFNLALIAVIAGLGYYLYKIIQDPIIFEREKKVRYAATVERLKDIRAAELAYKDKYGKFTKDFNALVNAMKNDSFPEVKIIGNPDDTSQVVSYDTTMILLRTRAEFTQGLMLDSLPFIPYSHGAKFTLDAGEVEKNKIKIQVFEASAHEPLFLKDLIEEYDKYINDKGYLTVGSMSEGTLSGNWE
jgi:hypothetical protein